MASGKTLQSTIEISGVLSPSLQAAIDGAVNRLADISEETLESADAASRLVAEMSTQEDMLKTLQRAYAGYVANGEEGNDQAQKLADTIRVVSGELEENRETLKAAEKAAQSLTDSQENAADAYTKLEKKISSQQNELAALRRQYANVALEQGENSDEARQLENRISSLSGELNQNKQKLNEAERAADSFGESLEDAGEKAENSSGGYTVLKNVIANLATEAISKAIDGFKEMAFEGDNALSKLEAKTGATGKEIEGLEEVMYEVYNANYGESLGDVSDTLSTVIQMTDDLDNASLTKVTKNSIALNDVFGFDTKESLRAVNSLMDQFGITSDQAYNLIVQGAQNGLNQNDDLLDTINEYSMQFKNAGYSADDMFNMLSNGVESGTWSVDKLGDAVKEFNIRASDGTISEAIEENAKAFDLTKEEAKALGTEIESGSVEAYQKLLDKLKEVDDDAQRYQMGVEMFGTMWEDLGEDAVFALMDTQGEINKTTDAMGQVDSAAYDTLESSLSQLGRTIKAEVVQPISEKLVPVAKAAVDFVTSHVAPAVDWVLDNLPTLGVALAGVAAAIVAFKWGSIINGIKGAATAFKTFGATLAANPIGLIIIAVTALVTAFVYLWDNCEGFRQFWINLWEGIKVAAKAVADWFVQAWQAICNFFTVTVPNAFNAVVSFFSGVWNSIVSACSNAWNAIVGVWSAVSSWFHNSVIAPVKNFFTGMWSTISGAASATWNAIVNVWTVVSSWFNNTIIVPVKNFFTGMWSGVVNGASAAWSGIKNIFSTVASFFGNIFGAAWEAVRNVFSKFGSVFSGIKDGIVSAFKAVVNVIIKGLNKVVALPFDGLNNILNRISGLTILRMKPFSWLTWRAPVPQIPLLAEGGFTDGVSIAGEAGTEAVISFDPAYREKNIGIWERAGQMLGVLEQEEQGAGLTSKAGELLTLDDFSLGSLADGTNVVIYYDFSHFTWSPQIHTEGKNEDEDDLMARLKAHEVEFFDWLEEFIQMREVAQYA